MSRHFRVPMRGDAEAGNDLPERITLRPSAAGRCDGRACPNLSIRLTELGFRSRINILVKVSNVDNSAAPAYPYLPGSSNGSTVNSTV
jgi:hypothetical protein